MKSVKAVLHGKTCEAEATKKDHQAIFGMRKIIVERTIHTKPLGISVS